LLDVPKGYNPAGVLTLALSPNSTVYPPGSSQREAYYREALARVQAIPGIQSAGLASMTPLKGLYDIMWIQIEGRQPFPQGQEPVVDANVISPEYFQAMGIELRAGRPFSAEDGAGAQLAIIINETIARRFFPNENPVGRRLLMGTTARTIVGVVGDTRQLSLDQKVHLEVYFPYMQYPYSVMNVAARVASGQNNPAGLASLTAAI
ncbi:MAG: ABC transporter permease, partial [Blastocatellia bacterium]|nr:ABC transporter permease [Blastocatellia bacterium]